MFFWNSLAFSLFQQMLAIWYLVPLPFLNLAWTTGSSWFRYYWSLAGRILSITLLACEISAIVWSLNILWHWLSLGLEWILTISSPVATAEFSKFAGILNAALSQHHLLGFEIVQLEFHPVTLFIVMLPKAQDWSPLGWAGRISLQSKGLSRVFSNTTVQKHQFFGAQLSL